VSAHSPLRILESGAAAFGLAISPSQLAQFERYLAELQKWNQRINLTAAKTLDELVRRHVLDSLAGLLVLHEMPVGARVADLGSGAGFPGLPIKIVRPDLHMTLIEPRQKRAAFLTTICALLQLEHVAIVEETIEPRHLGRDLAHQFDAVVMRAVKDSRTAKDLAVPLVKPGGKIVVWASTQQAEHASAGFHVLTYRIPETDITHALMVWRLSS
jgi:16S rRNA (guanine527-N7)-methyltransferase